MISVVMPAYNCEPFIGQAVESILNQTLTDIELIIVDDGSVDRTPSIASSYGDRDRRVRVLRSNHGGPSLALNIGIAEAKYDWLAVMHADDISLPKRLQTQLKVARENPRVVAWGTYAYHIGPTGNILGVSETGPSTEVEFHELRRRGELFTIIHPTALLKKDVVRAVGGYDPRFDCAEDLDLFERMAQYGPVLAIPEPLLFYRIHGSSNTMARFFKEKLFTRYVRARLRARISGEPLPTFEEFCRQYSHRPIMARLRTQLDDASKLFYRRSGLAVAEERYFRAGSFLGFSVLLNARYALPRLYKQNFSPGARRWLKGTPAGAE